MLIKKKIIGLMLGFVVSLSFSASANQVIFDDLIVGGTSDGWAPAYDCSPGATLPFYPLDSSSVSETIPAGDPCINVEPKLKTCVPQVDGTALCEYTCSTVSDIAACVGQDCVNGESFGNDTLRLKENNLRIRFHNTLIPEDVLGARWYVEANSSAKGGPSYFDFQMKSLEKDTLELSDGTAPEYDCSQGVTLTFFPLDSSSISETIPAGDPRIRVEPKLETCVHQVDWTSVCEFTCSEIPAYTIKSMFTLSPKGAWYNNNNYPVKGVAIGADSTVEEDAISVGGDGLTRRIARVAAGLSGTDALTLEGLEVLKQKIAGANAELDDIEKRIAWLETCKNNQTGAIIIEKRTDPAGMPDSFSFTGDVNGVVYDGGQITVDNLPPGTYSTTEAVPAGWNLGEIVCTDNDSFGDIASRTATVNLDVCETVICTFYNVREPYFGGGGTGTPANKRPVIDAVSAEQQGGYSVLFSIEAHDPDGEINEYNWQFTDVASASSPGTSILHNFGGAGTYEVTVTAEDNGGGRTSETISVEVVESDVTPPAPGEETGCTEDADRDDGEFCSGEEACLEGACVTGAVPCADNELCMEDEQACWTQETIEAKSLISTFRRPRLRGRRCVWLALDASGARLFDPQASEISCSGPNDDDAGVARHPRRQIRLFKDYVLVPLCIKKEAEAGAWLLQLETVSGTALETITTTIAIE